MQFLILLGITLVILLRNLSGILDIVKQGVITMVKAFFCVCGTRSSKICNSHKFGVVTKKGLD